MRKRTSASGNKLVPYKARWKKFRAQALAYTRGIELTFHPEAAEDRMDLVKNFLVLTVISCALLVKPSAEAEFTDTELSALNNRLCSRIFIKVFCANLFWLVCLSTETANTSRKNTLLNQDSCQF